MPRKMRRIGAMTAFCVAALARTALPCAIPIIHPIPRPRPTPVPRPIRQILTHQHHAEIQIRDQVARVTVSAEFYNPNPMQMEGTYFFPLEEEATVSAFSMVVNGKEAQAELLPADKARRIYEDIVRRKKDPGLLEYVGTKMLKARVFPIEPHKAIKIKLQYDQTIKEEGGLCHLRYPLRGAKPNEGDISQLSVSVSLESSTPLKTVYSPSHAVDVVRDQDKTAKLSYEATKVVPDRDFDIYFSRAAGDIGLSLLSHKPAKEDGYFLVAVSPKVAVASGEIQKKSILFVADTSGSMAGEKIEQAKNALSFCVNSLNPGDRFNIVTFSTEARPFKDSLTDLSKEALEEAREYIKAIRARGGTAIHEAMTMALGMAGKEKGLTMIIFLTDGKPTIGEANIDRILADARKLNTSNSRIFVFGVGYDVNTDLLDKLAEQSRGAKEYVVEKEDIEVKVSAFYTKVAHPVLSDTKLVFEGAKVYDVYPKTLPDIFRGSQLMVFGRYRGAGRKALKVAGTINGKPREFVYTVELGEKESNEFLPRVWAMRKVAYLLSEIRLHKKSKELVDEVVALGKQYGIVTPYTSFLIVEDDVPAPVRRQLSSARREFEEARSGRGAVHDSLSLGRLKAANAPAPAGAADGIGYGGGEAAQAVRKLVQKKIHHISDKTFFLERDGYLYDSLFTDKDRARTIDVKFLSDEYFELVRKHPKLGRYLSAGKKLVVCFEGKVYRVIGE